MDDVRDRSVTGGITVLNEIQPPPPSPTAFPLWKLLQVALINSSGDREVYMTRNTLGEEQEEQGGGSDRKRRRWRGERVKVRTPPPHSVTGVSEGPVCGVTKRNEERGGMLRSRPRCQENSHFLPTSGCSLTSDPSSVTLQATLGNKRGGGGSGSVVRFVVVGEDKAAKI